MATENKPTVETKESLTAELIPEEGNPNVGFKIFQILDEILQFKSDQGLPTKWARNYELSRNKHWKNKSKKVSLVTANLLHTHRTRTVNMLTDNNPTFNVKQVGEVDGQKEEIFDSLLHTAEYWWTEQEQQAVLEASVSNGEMYGATVEKVIFNSDLESGIGEVETLVVDLYHFGWYPVRTMDIQKAEAVLHFWPISVREARRKWSDKAETIKADEEILKELGDTRINAPGQSSKSGSFFSSFSGIVKKLFNNAESSTGMGDEVLIVECWVKDYSRVPVEGKENTTEDKYSGNIRCIQCCNGGSVVLSDRDNPSINPDLEPTQASQTYLWDKYPFSKTQSITDTSDPWGMSDYEQLEQLNLEVDKAVSQATLLKDQVSRLKIKNPLNSGVSNKQFTNAPGIINPKNEMAAQAIGYMDLPKIPFADIVATIEMYKGLFDEIAGKFELDSAKGEGNVIAYKAIAALLEHASVMRRGKIRNYSRMIRVRGRMYISLATNWYTEPRWVSYEQDGENMTKAIQGKDMLIPAKLGVVSGSTMPVSRVQERDEAIELFKLGAIDNEAMLSKLDWPDRKQIVNRMRLGPLGEFIERLSAMNFPPAMLEGLQAVGEMETKEFDRDLEKGEIPTFQDLFQVPEEPGQNPMERAELDKADAEIRKTDAEIALIEEKINTEKVNQSVALAGVEFDNEKLAIERAKTIAEIKAKEEEQKNIAKDTTKSSNKNSQGPYREKGMVSNNKEK